MKKSIIKISILLILFLGIIYTPFIIKADSGFDSSYDSGGSWDSGGSSWGGSSDWGSSSSWSSSSSSSSTHGKINASPIEIFIGCLMVLVYIIIKNVIKSALNQNSKSSKPIRLLPLPLSISAINEKLPNFDINEFNHMVFGNYEKIQYAWMNFNLESIKNLVSDEIYNMYGMQLSTLKVKGQKNIMKEISYQKNYISNININNNVTTIDTILTVSCYDYIIDSNNNVVRGYKDVKWCYTYRLTFEKKNNESIINKCQNCGAEINSQTDTKCPYCNAVIVNNNSNWIMTKKEMLDQTEQNSNKF